MAPDTRIISMADRLIDCVQERLEDTSGGAVERACVITGAMAWDSECLCGELIADITSAYPSKSFPTPFTNDGSLGRCGAPYLVYSLTMTILRCVPGADEQGRAPSCEALASAALIAVEDASAVYAGVLCCLGEALVEKESMTGAPVLSGYQMGQQLFVGPAGYCGGSALTILLGFLIRCPCDDD